jgi:hypothetical protein
MRYSLGSKNSILIQIHREILSPLRVKDKNVKDTMQANKPTPIPYKTAGSFDLVSTNIQNKIYSLYKNGCIPY